MNAAPTSRERAKFCGLFWIQCHAQALWYVPFSNVLRAHDLGRLIPYAFASASIAAFVSPMLSGVLADRHVSAERLLRWMASGIGLFLALTFLAIEQRWGPWWVLGFLIIEQLFAAPAWGLACAIVLGRLEHPEREFGAVRAWATFGWMAAGPLLSFVLMADRSTRSGFAAAAAWGVVALFTYVLPTAPPLAPAIRSWRDRFSGDAFRLFRERNHRSVFIAAALYNIPMAAFYPFATIHLQALGESRVAAAMSIGQITEIIAAYALATLLVRFPFKTILLMAITAGVARYALFALNTLPWLIAGIALHGMCFTLFFVAAQIYLESRVDPQFRSRAQTLMTVMTDGFGNLLGALGCGWWFAWCSGQGGATRWPEFWGMLSVATLVVWVIFAVGYRRSGRLATWREKTGA
jgi:MFS family permease